MTKITNEGRENRRGMILCNLKARAEVTQQRVRSDVGQPCVFEDQRREVYSNAVIATQAPQHFFRRLKESAFDSNHDLSSRSGKPCRIAAYRFLPVK